MKKQLHHFCLKHTLARTLIAFGLASGLVLSAHAASETDKINERLNSLEKQVAEAGANSSTHNTATTGVPLHGFYDVGYAASNNGQYGPKGFDVTSFDLYLTPQFDDRLKSLVELIFEVDSDGGLATDLERIQIGYTFSDSATLWAGRFHTPFGYWNAGFHHGAQIQTSIRRPRFIDFEDKGGVLPSHMTGTWLTGNLHAGTGKVNYDLYAGNGPRLDIDTASANPNTGINSPAAGSDDNHQAFVGFNLGYNFIGAADGLRLGTHGFKGDVIDTLGNKTDVAMSGLYGAYINNDWEVLSEYYRFSDKVKASAGPAVLGSTNSSNAWFTQVAKEFDRWTPFIRCEKTTLSQGDPYFFNQISGVSYARHALGVRYELNTTSALKLELDRTKFNGTNADKTVTPGDEYSEAIVQWSVRF